jgi:methyl-accepting chemotaxis protein
LVHSSVNVATEARGHGDELGEQMDRVNLVLQSITNIADQTELIALDARITAARSGEAGKDFGRVAQQVGDLAQMSSTAADEVKELISEIKASTLGVARSLGLSIERIQSLLYQARLVDEVFGEIKGSFDEILCLMNEVKNAANKGAAEAELVQTSMAEILESARQVAEQAGELAEEMFEVANGAQAAVEASETVASGIVSQAELAKEQSRLAQQVTCEITKLA